MRMDDLRRSVTDILQCFLEALPEWAQDWIRKAEEGPLWVVLGR
jgi:hypothetical protein